MRILENELKNRAINYKALQKYGFIKENEKYIYKSKIYNEQFEVIVEVEKDQMCARLIDLASEDEYVLVDIPDSTGEFVGNVRKEYEDLLNDIIKKSTVANVFKSKQAKDVIQYIKEKYGDDLEFLWEKFEGTAIWRNKHNDKWYALLCKLSKRKLGIESDEIVEIIDLRYPKEQIEEYVDFEKIYPGYHMNKKSWITIKLDNSVDIKTIYSLIDNSYNISIGNKCGFAGDKLSEKMLEYLTTIPKGKVVTYKQVAEYLGNKGLARVVGNMLHKNPDGDKYPCYKVLNSKGELAEAFVFGGKNVQKERLQKDGIEVINDKVDLKVYQWEERKKDD